MTQLPDGTMVFTTPSGRVHFTEPLGAVLFPQLAVPTGELALPDEPGARCGPRVGDAEAKTHPRRGARLANRMGTRSQPGALRGRPATVLTAPSIGSR